MSEKLSPSEAWLHVKALCKDADHILPYYGSDKSISVYLGNSRAFVMPVSIDWPEGMTRYPPEEPQWRDAVMPQDWGKLSRVRNEDGEWKQHILQGKSKHCWAAGGTWWACCQVRVDPNETQIDLAPKTYVLWIQSYAKLLQCEAKPEEVAKAIQKLSNGNRT